MRFSEFQNGLQNFKVAVRLKTNGGSQTVRTMVSAESMAQVQRIVRHVFGKEALVSINQISMREDVAEETKILSPQELQVKSLADQAKRLNQQAKLKKAQTKLSRAQEALRSASK